MHRYIQLYATKHKQTAFQSVDTGIAASQTRLLQHSDARPSVNDSVNCSGGCELTCHRLGPRSGCPVQVVSPENLHSDAHCHLPGVVCRRNRNVPLFWTLNSGNSASHVCEHIKVWAIWCFLFLCCRVPLCQSRYWSLLCWKYRREGGFPCFFVFCFFFTSKF